MMNRAELKNEQMEQVVGGKSVFDNFEKRKVSGLKTGWLALRNDTAYDPKNEIGQLYNGDEEKPSATGYTRHCFLDDGTRMPVSVKKRIPEVYRRLMAAFEKDSAENL